MPLEFDLSALAPSRQVDEAHGESSAPAIPVPAKRGFFGRHPVVAEPPEQSITQRLPAFAADNGLLYERMTPDPAYPHPVFSGGWGRRIEHHLTPIRGPFFDIGTYVRDEGGSRRSELSTGFVAVRLERVLPAMSVHGISSGNARRQESPVADGYVVSLEGGYDDHFTLRCPARHKSEALFFFTPQLLEAVTGTAFTFDIEVAGDWVFAFADGPFTTADHTLYERMFRLINLVANNSRLARY